MCVCVCVNEVHYNMFICILLLGNPNFKASYLLTQGHKAVRVGRSATVNTADI